MGQCFRTGGDEFVVVTRMDGADADAALENLERASEACQGTAESGLHLASGYALARDYPGYALEKLVAQADAVMYEAKRAYYNQPEHERRRRDAP
jgi:GGDEF domain-containing protein